MPFVVSLSTLVRAPAGSTAVSRTVLLADCTICAALDLSRQLRHPSVHACSGNGMSLCVLCDTSSGSGMLLCALCDISSGGMSLCALCDISSGGGMSLRALCDIRSGSGMSLCALCDIRSVHGWLCPQRLLCRTRGRHTGAHSTTSTPSMSPRRSRTTTPPCPPSSSARSARYLFCSSCVSSASQCSTARGLHACMCICMY